MLEAAGRHNAGVRKSYTVIGHTANFTHIVEYSTLLNLEV